MVLPSVSDCIESLTILIPHKTICKQTQTYIEAQALARRSNSQHALSYNEISQIKLYILQHCIDIM
jgi:hypothetical protein